MPNFPNFMMLLAPLTGKSCDLVSHWRQKWWLYATIMKTPLDTPWLTLLIFPPYFLQLGFRHVNTSLLFGDETQRLGALAQRARRSIFASASMRRIRIILIYPVCFECKHERIDFNENVIAFCRYRGHTFVTSGWQRHTESVFTSGDSPACDVGGFLSNHRLLLGVWREYHGQYQTHGQNSTNALSPSGRQWAAIVVGLEQKNHLPVIVLANVLRDKREGLDKVVLNVHTCSGAHLKRSDLVHHRPDDSPTQLLTPRQQFYADHSVDKLIWHLPKSIHN